MRMRGLGRIAVGAIVGCALAVPASAGAGEGVTPGHMVDVTNYLKDAPKQSSEIVLPMTLQQPPGKRGLYFAEQFYFQNGKGPSYTGIKPEKVNPDGTSVNNYAFSTFDAAATTDDPNCQPGADGGGGVSCRAHSDLVPNRPYELRAKIVGSDGQREKIEGTVVDTASGQAQHLGSFYLPAAAGPLTSTTLAFMEHYDKVPNCEAIPRAATLLGTPRLDGKPYAFTSAKNGAKQDDCPGKGAAALEPGGLRLFY